MAQPSTQDLTAPFDPTAYTSITGAQLLQYIQGAYPGTNTGLVITTTDTAGNPNVPDANTNTKWQKYIWQRVATTSNSITLYVWNPNAAADVTYLQWVPAFAAAIGAATIQGYQIAPNTITDGNIANVNWSKVQGAPTTINSGSAAGGDLSGTYPNPTVAPLAITTGKIALNAVTGGAAGQLATGANGATLANNIAVPAASTYASPSGAAAGAPLANDRVVVGVGATSYATIRKVIDALAEPVAGDALKVPQINAGGTGFQYATPASIGARILQSIVYSSTVGQSTATTLALTGTAPTTGNTTLCTLFGTGGTMTFTPLSASSRVRVRVTLQMYNSNANAAMHAHIFNNTTPVASGVAASSGAGTPACLTVLYDFAPGATTAIPFLVYFAGVGGTTCINETNTPTAFFGGGLSSSTVEITEYL